MITRYSHCCVGAPDTSAMYETDTGKYVLFTDHEAEVKRKVREETQECFTLINDFTDVDTGILSKLLGEAHNE